MNTEAVKAVDEIRTALEGITQVADDAFCRSRPDRTSDGGAFEAAILGLLGWPICQGYCVIEALECKTPQGVAPNVRSMLEALITAQYLTDPDAAEDERRDRLDRYFRGVRREQVKLRNALDAYPPLKKLGVPPVRWTV